MTEPAASETHVFQAEVQQLLHLMVHSLYSNREIFLRELISNASDACDKLRFEALTNPELLSDDPDLEIRVEFDEAARTVTVSDNGIGMNRDEVVANLGTIARSGTREFLASLTGDNATDTQLIGQFGVGFYSSFVVADRVSVITRRAGLPADEAVHWESTGEGEYTLEFAERAARGTTVVLHLRDAEFADGARLRGIVRKYADHIALPVRMPGEADESGEVQWETANRAAALWSRPRSEIEDSEYHEFYKHVAHDFEDPLAWTHHRVEGKLEYTSLLFIPRRAPWDLWQPEQTQGVKLYVQRVFIMDDVQQFLPRYLRFVRGVIDSADLPLNVSREILQSNRVAERIRAGCVKQVLGLLEEMATEREEDYALCWSAFGNVLKEGLGEDSANRERLAGLLRFASTQAPDVGQTQTLAGYIERMKSGQKAIYYITADSLQRARSSPHLELFHEKDVEVILFHDRVDEWVVAHLHEFDGHPLRSVGRGELDPNDLGDSDTEEKKDDVAPAEFDAFVTRLRDSLGDRVENVRLSQRLRNSPACVVTPEGGMGGHLERMLREAGQEVPSSRPVLEINPRHPVVLKARAVVDEQRFSDWAVMLLEQAMLADGSKLDDPAAFVRRVNEVIVSLAD